MSKIARPRTVYCLLLTAFCLLLLTACDPSSGYTYTPAYEPPAINPSQAATVAESYVNLQITQQAAEAQIAADNANFNATSTARAGEIAIRQFDATQTAAAKTAEYEGTAWSATMTQDATNSAGALQAANAEATRVQSAANLQVAQDGATATAVKLDADRQEMTNTFNAWAARLFLAGVGIASAAVIIALVWFIGRALARKKENQASIQATGPNGINPLGTVQTEKGLVVFNPATTPAMTIDHKTGVMTPLAPFGQDDQTRAMLAFLYTLFQQAQNDIFPPVKPETPTERKNRWQFGPVAHETSTRPILPPAPFSPPDRPTLPTSQPQPALAQPPAEVVDADIVILPPDHPDVQPIVEEVEAKLLTNGGQS